jgi:hypothetical protein
MVETTTVCMNIGRGQRQLRYISALMFALVAIGLDVLILSLRLERGWRLALLPLIWIGTFSLLEAVQKTCVQLVARNEQSLDDNLIISRTLHGDKIQDSDLNRALRHKARIITAQVVIITSVLMALVMIFPM